MLRATAELQVIIILGGGRGNHQVSIGILVSYLNTYGKLILTLHMYSQQEALYTLCILVYFLLE